MAGASDKAAQGFCAYRAGDKLVTDHKGGRALDLKGAREGVAISAVAQAVAMQAANAGKTAAEAVEACRQAALEMGLEGEEAEQVAKQAVVSAAGVRAFAEGQGAEAAWAAAQEVAEEVGLLTHPGRLHRHPAATQTEDQPGTSLPAVQPSEESAWDAAQTDATDSPVKQRAEAKTESPERKTHTAAIPPRFVSFLFFIFLSLSY